MTALSFTKTEIPATVSTRTAEPNPFADVFPADAEALSFTIDGESHVTKDGKTKFAPAVAKLQGQAQKAANAVDRSARFQARTEGKGKNAKTVVTVWTVAKITRKREDAPASE